MQRHGGWFRSGDGGYLKDGYLFINDRIKDMIISGGENISTADTEPGLRLGLEYLTQNTMTVIGRKIEVIVKDDPMKPE